MRKVGFSTGAVAYGNFEEALDLLAPHHLPCIELSALRITEVSRLLDAIPRLGLNDYSYISFHAPSSYSAAEEKWLTDLLYFRVPANWPIILHPDAICDWTLWARFNERIAIENMDRRKSIGRSVAELATILSQLPAARFCLDLGHARQYDSSMTEAFLMLTALKHRLVQIHLSEVNSDSQHEPISYGAMLSFQEIASLVPAELPIILESRVKALDISREVISATESLPICLVEEPCYA